ncbi:sulfite exporter TauE/SafE family protein [Saccharopolyspora erythraea]|uniref:sulfite exporter TauE/SafE family protein n=1 Tax=Saccharopolyspora erythraea TaxID=1836 RepID=UPI001BAD225E|nr:sulfite exporter TauE/SafE family protein [Saccharopolyspora erythraea]QUH04025.1 sulfite exporter TauE/SafE family protein [Saccharopolyspora erythraea]
MLAAVLPAVPVLLGAFTQRATGLGFGLFGGPMLIAMTGPVVGVSLANTLSILLCVLVLARTWRDADWRAVLKLGLPALAAIPIGALVVHQLPEGPLLILVGTLVIAAIGLVVLGRSCAILRGTGGAVVAGALSGFMNVTAGVGGPMVSVYALSQRWNRKVLVPTAQAYLLLINLVSVASKGVPDLTPLGWISSITGLVLGAVAGEWLDRRLNARTGHWLIIFVALAGGLAALIRGLIIL